MRSGVESGHAAPVKAPEAPVRALCARTQSPRPAGKVPTGTPRAGPRSPYSLPQRDPAQGSLLPGPRKVETHFRRVHDLPRLLLSLAAGDGTGHLDSGTGQRSPPFLAGFRRAGHRGFSSGTVSALSALLSQHTRSDCAWRVGAGKIARTQLSRSTGTLYVAGV